MRESHGEWGRHVLTQSPGSSNSVVAVLLTGRHQHHCPTRLCSQGELAPEGGKQGYTVSVKNDLLFPAGGSGARRFGSAKEAGTCAVAARLLGMVAQGGPWVAVVEVSEDGAPGESRT